MFGFFVAVILAYIIGSFPTSYLMAKLVSGVDIRQHGSGNVGATNTFRVVGKIPGIIVLIVDALKGFVCVKYLPCIINFANIDVTFSMAQVLIGAAVISGHIWTIFLNFKGGKGVATGAGVLFALNQMALVIGVVVWIFCLAVTRYVSMSSIFACVSIFLYLLFSKSSLEYIILVGMASLAIILRHIPNIKRVLSGKESKIVK